MVFEYSISMYIVHAAIQFFSLIYQPSAIQVPKSKHNLERRFHSVIISTSYKILHIYYILLTSVMHVTRLYVIFVLNTILKI